MAGSRTRCVRNVHRGGFSWWRITHSAYLRRLSSASVLCLVDHDLAEHSTKILTEWWYSFAAAAEREMFPEVTRKRKCCPRPTGPLTKHHCCGLKMLSVARNCSSCPRRASSQTKKHHCFLRQKLPLRGRVAKAKSRAIMRLDHFPMDW